MRTNSIIIMLFAAILSEIPANYASAAHKVVYLQLDMKGSVNYVGEGNPGRPYSKHYNKGFDAIANNGGRIVIVKTGLTKKESLALEKKLIEKYARGGIANIKENHYKERYHINQHIRRDPYTGW